MSSIDTIRLTLVTGSRGTDEPVRLRVNGQEMAMHRISGGTATGETWEGQCFLAIELRSCHLVAPSAAPWDLRSLVIDCSFEDGTRTTTRAPGHTVAPAHDLDLLALTLRLARVER